MIRQNKTNCPVCMKVSTVEKGMKLCKKHQHFTVSRCDICENRRWHYYQKSDWLYVCPTCNETRSDDYIVEVHMTSRGRRHGGYSCMTPENFEEVVEEQTKEVRLPRFVSPSNLNGNNEVDPGTIRNLEQWIMRGEVVSPVGCSCSSIDVNIHRAVVRPKATKLKF